MAPENQAVKSATLPSNDVDGDLASAHRVLKLESEALQALADSLGAEFSQALDLFQATTGRVVVTGMGKSGHVAVKIAATMSSTGTPALFVHPAEASHGDLGMITPVDSVLALSNSGETHELSDLVAYTRRFKIPLVAITANKNSTLVEAADVALTLPESEEACPMGLAPTTSTTLMMALGDTIAVALMERKGFSPGDYYVLHPRGQLAQRTIKVLRVSDLMNTGDQLPLASGDSKVADVLVEMTVKSLGCIGIATADNRLEGIITDGDLRRHLTEGVFSRPARDIMTVGPKTIRPSALASEAVQIMNEKKITNLFVTEDDIVVGLIHIHDCLRAGVA
jgi:arabinose-5-phosphate isomerase